MVKKRKQVDGFSMSFLDVMACGLGAVILIFILVDFDGGQGSTPEEQRLNDALNLKKQQIIDLQAQKITIEDEIKAQTQAQQQALDTQNQQSEVQARLYSEMTAKLAQIAELEQQLNTLKQTPNPNASLSIVGDQAPQYLTGMKVEGRNIAILVDKSASMMDDTLVGVLRALSFNDANRKNTAKWQRTLKVANWVMANVPVGAKVSLITFSDSANLLGQSTHHNTSDFHQLAQSLQKTTPDGGTNLQLGLQVALANDPSLSDVYLITDGLPTLGEGLSLACKGVLKSKKSISSDCRQQLLLATIGKVNKALRVNVILLPIDGDPYAASMYWGWTQVTGGRFLAPSADWPQ
ncbi:Secreted protein, containing von Willebrand factor (VWF) type A domain [Pseudoalteromonas luteoviolacea B = ATCC 29581]|nr:Secreted protein, containing von Willebrand factor (VWF) type A domain [Pseudoalteromonas luteoviolacea B = ATCC 29581]